MVAKKGALEFGNVQKIGRRFYASYPDPLGRMKVTKGGNETKMRIRAPHSFISKKDAVAWLTDQDRRISAGTWADPTEEQAQRAAEDARTAITFREYAERWLEERRNSRGEALAPLTRAKYESSLKTHVYPTFGDRTIVSITNDDVRAWEKTVAPGRPTARAHAYGTFRTILNSAVTEDRIIERNPVYVRGAGVRHTQTEVVPATFDELDTIVAAMPERHRMLVLLAAWCGLRSGELRELRRADVTTGTLDDGEPFGWLRVRRAVVQAPTKAPEGRHTAPVVRQPKTLAGRRDVAIPPHLIEPLRSHLDRHVDAGDDGLLFSSRDGGHLAESTFNGRAAVLDPVTGEVIKAGFGWREARRVAGRPDLDLHHLRHTAASLADEAGASDRHKQSRLGHATASMTRHYTHATRQRDLELAARLTAMEHRRAARPV